MLLAASLLLPIPVLAQQLFAATVRGQAGAPETGGNLYKVNLGSGDSTIVAPLRVKGGGPIGVTGLAVHPQTGVLYGVTAAASNPGLHLVTIDPATAEARVVGDLGHPGSDIAFSTAGILYVWLHQRGQPGIINLQSGAVTPIGPAQSPQEPGGFAIDRKGQAYVVRGGASGTLDTVDLATAVVKRGPALSGAPMRTMRSMKFSIAGLLVGINSSDATPSKSILVTVNVASGQVAMLGSLPDDVDGLAFTQPLPPASDSRWGDGSMLALGVLAIVALLLGLIAWDVRQQRRRR